MHPILASRRYALLYLLAWTPIFALLVFIAWAGGGIRWQDAALVLTPACLVYAFACLSPWYICRVRPLRFTNLAGTLATWAVAASAGSGVLVGGAWLTSAALGVQPAQLPLLFGAGVLLYLLATGLHYTALAIAEQRAAERNAAEAHTLARESQLQALRFQLNPHFLFNSLHSIAALATLDGVRAREMCVRLSDFLRASLGLGDRESIPLREELALARNYLEVEQVRFGARLRVEENIEEACESCLIPALLLQPLVENAVKHGIAGLVEGGSIRLAAARSGEAVSIEIENACEAAAPAPRNAGLGLAHVRRRLQVRYGGEATFSAGAGDGVYRVVLRLPCESPIASSSRA